MEITQKVTSSSFGIIFIGSMPTTSVRLIKLNSEPLLRGTYALLLTFSFWTVHFLVFRPLEDMQPTVLSEKRNWVEASLENVKLFSSESEFYSSKLVHFAVDNY